MSYSLIDDDNNIAFSLAGNATAGRDDDTIDADQTNNGDSQANAVRSRVNQSDDDGNRRDTDSHDDNSNRNVGNTDSNDNNSNQNVGNTDSNDNNSNQNVGNSDSNDNNSNQNVGNSDSNDDNSNQNVGNTDSSDDNSNLNVGNTDSNDDNSNQNVGNTDSNDDNDDNDILDFTDVDNFDIDSLLADALNGAGNDMAFSLDQTNTMTDNDRVSDPDVSYNGGGGSWDYDRCDDDCWDGESGPGGGFHQTATATGGTARMNDFNSSGTSGGAGHDTIEAQSMTSADAALTQEAFTQNLTLGANIQYNLAETSVVGGASSDTGGADDA